MAPLAVRGNNSVKTVQKGLNTEKISLACMMAVCKRELTLIIFVPSGITVEKNHHTCIKTVKRETLNKEEYR